jgi:hypothetical protein
MIEPGSTAGGDTTPWANMIPTSTTEQSNRISTTKRVPLRLHSFSIDRAFEKKSAIAATLRTAMTLWSFSY